MLPCQVIIEPAAEEGAWNMALDEALLRDSLAHHSCWLRWYRWREPTLSLGYFQNTEDDVDLRWQSLPAVRRLSGGGAILHDREWTYSCILPSTHPLTDRPAEIYRLVHSGVINVLQRRGIETHLRGEHAPSKPADAFLCFERGDPNDVLLGDHKFLGSAQRRRRGTVLQHGSLILQRSDHAPEVAGLFELSGITFDSDELVAQLAPAVAQRLSAHWSIIGAIPEAIRDDAKSLWRDKYSRGLDWNRGGSTGELSSD